jgi:hypothetical protein
MSDPDLSRPAQLVLGAGLSEHSVACSNHCFTQHILGVHGLPEVQIQTRVPALALRFDRESCATFCNTGAGEGTNGVRSINAFRAWKMMNRGVS